MCDLFSLSFFYRNVILRIVFAEALKILWRRRKDTVNEEKYGEDKRIKCDFFNVYGNWRKYPALEFLEQNKKV